MGMQQKGDTPLKTNDHMTGWKITSFNRKYIHRLIHGGCSSECVMWSFSGVPTAELVTTSTDVVKLERGSPSIKNGNANMMVFFRQNVGQVLTSVDLTRQRLNL